MLCNAQVNAEVAMKRKPAEINTQSFALLSKYFIEESDVMSR